MRYFLILSIIAIASCRKDNLKGNVEELKPAILAKITEPLTANSLGYYIALPSRYNSDIDKINYPLIISLSGAGSYGDSTKSLESVLEYGPMSFLNRGEMPPSFKVSNDNISFVYAAPQFINPPNSTEIYNFLKELKSILRIDESRIYLMGSSVGGRTATDFAAEYPEEITALVSMSGVSDYNVTSKVAAIAGNNLPVWVFHNSEDFAWPKSSALYFVEELHKLNPIPLPFLTIIPEVDHNAWLFACDPSFKENETSVYEWFLKFQK